MTTKEQTMRALNNRAGPCCARGWRTPAASPVRAKVCWDATAWSQGPDAVREQPVHADDVDAHVLYALRDRHCFSQPQRQGHQDQPATAAMAGLGDGLRGTSSAGA